MAILSSLLSSTLMRALSDTYRRAVLRGTERAMPVGTERVLYEHARRKSQRIRTALSLDVLAAMCRIVESGDPDVPTDARRLDAPSPLAVEAMLREAGWDAFRSLPTSFQYQYPHPKWTDGLRAAVADALATAAAHGAERPHGGHLLLGLCADPDSGASRLLKTAGADRAEVMRALSAGDQLRQTAEPWVPGVDLLQMTGVLAIDGRNGRIARRLIRTIGRMATGYPRAYSHGSPVVACLQFESVRQAVLLGDYAVRPRHVALAILTIEDQLAAVGEQLPARIARQNAGGAMLGEHGVTYDRILRPVADLEAEATEIVSEPLLFFAPVEPTMPRWTAAAADLWAAARTHADRLGHGHTGTAHVLLALLDDPSGETGRLLGACDADPELVREHVSTSLAAPPAA